MGFKCVFKTGQVYMASFRICKEIPSYIKRPCLKRKKREEGRDRQTQRECVSRGKNIMKACLLTIFLIRLFQLCVCVYVCKYSAHRSHKKTPDQLNLETLNYRQL